MLRLAVILLLMAGQALAQDRVLSLGGAVTETVYALGAGTTLVGCDLTSVFPARATALPKVGYLRALGAEGVLSLSPSLVLASADAGPPAALHQIAAAGVQVLSLPETHSADAAVERVLLVGAAMDRKTTASDIAAVLRSDLQQVSEDVAALAGKPRVLFLLSAGVAAPLAAGTGTAADAMIRMAGATNATEGFRGYRALTAEAALLAEPDWIVTTSETMRGVGGMDKLLAGPGLAATPAGTARRVAAFDSLYLLGFGPRLAQAQRDLAATLHPGATLRPLPPRPWLSSP